MTVEYDKDLSRHNTFGLKVSCACYVEFGSEDELRKIYGAAGEFGFPQPFLHIGSGSNLLFTRDFPGTVFHSAIRFVRPLDSKEKRPGEDDVILVEVGSGVLWDDFCAWCADRGLWGPENLSGIPGETGSAAVQNIGAYGVEAKDVISRVRCFDVVTGTFRTLDAAECSYGYRDSVFKDTAKGRYVVTSVVFMLSSTPAPRLEYGHVREAVEKVCGPVPVPASQGNSCSPGPDTQSETEWPGALTPGLVRDTVIGIRDSKLPDPSVTGNAGSFFKNPVVPRSSYSIVENYAKGRYGEGYSVPHFDMGSGFIKIPAAWLIEQCGWKGYREGNVGVYEKQPLVIVNVTGKAVPDEIIALENKIVHSVSEKFGITLHPEVEHV